MSLLWKVLRAKSTPLQSLIRHPAHLLVMPMSRMLLSASTPSILVSSWLTSVSCTPDPLCTLPRALQMASISSKMITCSSLASPRAACSASAS